MADVVSPTEVRARFEGSLSAPYPIPDDGIDAAVRVMRDGRLFRYGEDRGSVPEAATLEEEFAALMGRRFCVGLNSGGCALFVALRAAGVEPGDKVLVNAFTLAPVPGAIHHAAAIPVLVDINDRYVIDLDDLDRKAQDSGARFLMLSYMRGHIPDMDGVLEVCARRGLTLIEDCAHTMAAGWDGRLTGTFGAAGCFSTQAFKHVNSGEGGLLVTDDEDLAARAILLSGSYMLYAQHRARPPEAVFERYRHHLPNCSMRMSNLVAAVLRPQLRLLDDRAAKWRRLYDDLDRRLRAVPHLVLPDRPAREQFVPTSLQFTVDALPADRIRRFLSEAGDHGVHIKWFGAEQAIGFTSRPDHWRYLDDAAIGSVPTAEQMLHRLCDIRIPVWLSQEDTATIAAVVAEAMEVAMA